MCRTVWLKQQLQVLDQQLLNQQVNSDWYIGAGFHFLQFPAQAESQTSNPSQYEVPNKVSQHCRRNVEKHPFLKPCLPSYPVVTTAAIISLDNGRSPLCGRKNHLKKEQDNAHTCNFCVDSKIHSPHSPLRAVLMRSHTEVAAQTTSKNWLGQFDGAVW